MFYKDICRILGLYLFSFAAALVLPLLLALYYQFFAAASDHPQPHAAWSFLFSLLVTLGMASGFYYYGRNSRGHIFRKEGIATVVIIWILTPALSALPFWFSETLANPWAAYFEATSGLTTTGSTAMQAKKYDPLTGVEIPIVTKVRNVIDTDYHFFGTIEPIRDPFTHQILYEGIEAVSKALLFWRAFIQWLGGVGIVVLFVAILPVLGAGGKVLFHAEMPGPLKESLTPRIKETALQIWKIYCALTLLQVVLLMVSNAKMEWLDAVTTTFTTLSTGGFSIRNAGISYYDSAATEWIIIVFMMFGSINFSLYYYILRGKIYRLYEPEFIIYLAIVLLICAIASLSLAGTPKYGLLHGSETLLSWPEAIRYGSFQMISAISTTGFSTANFDKWPYAVQALMLIVMFVGGMSGSTAGGIKIMRHYILFRIAQYKTESLYRPQGIQIFKVGNSEVDAGAMIMVLCFFLTIISISVAGTFIYILDGIDPETSLGLVACMINCTGLSFRAADPLNSCAFLSNFGYFFSSLLMILGRLEFFAILAFISPAFWKRS